MIQTLHPKALLRYGFTAALLLLALAIACQPSVVLPAQAADTSQNEENRDADNRDAEKNSASLKAETRAVWSWAGRRAEGRAAVDQLVAQVDQARLNVVLIQIYKDGTAFFEPSQRRFPNPAERLTNQTPFVDAQYSDALAYLIAIRNQRRADDDPANDFEVHAWFAVHTGGKVQPGARWPQPDATAPYMLNALFPEFKLKYGDFYRKNDERYVDHAVSVVQQPRFQAYISDLIAGVVEEYGVDGVHLDYIRTGGICFNNDALDYPGKRYDYPGCQQDYANWTKATYGRAYSLWDDTDGHRVITDDSGRVEAWLGQAVDQLVKRVHDEVKAVNSATILSVAAVVTIPENQTIHATINGQAAWHWLDQGWIDVAFPTFYSTRASNIAERVDLFRQAMEDKEAYRRVFPGLAVYDIARNRGRRPAVLVDQLKVLLQEKGTSAQRVPTVQGIALFRAEFLDERTIRRLATGPFRQPATPYWGHDYD
jgi:uncharacterized lipoprotein YddW (UPF0748 family)